MIAWRPIVALAACMLGAGCAIGPRLQDTPVEVESVPFYAQTAHQCGPAALATVLDHSGVSVTPDTIADEVYLPGLEGSLQVEMLAAARRHGRIPFLIPHDCDALLDELEAGNPVLVLQNLAFERFPKWHYAVVVGYEPERNRFILRSGKKERKTENSLMFQRYWRMADYWGMVTVPPGRLPVTATAATWAKAVAGSEKFLTDKDVEKAYRVALERWPDSALLLFAAANFHYGQGDLKRAYGEYQRLLDADPKHVAGRNNFANLLLDSGCAQRALGEIRLAADGLQDDDPLSPAVEDSLARTQSALKKGSANCRLN